MARICGIIFKNNPIQGAIKQMLSQLRIDKSTPEEIFQHENASFGVTKGAIFHQQEKNILVMIDGNISNINEIQKQFSLSNCSPEEVICHLYEKENDQFIKHIEGSFAIAIYHIQQKELLLFRDRLGKKPLYWSYCEGNFLFSSELKGVLSSSLLTLSPDVEALKEYFTFGYFPLENTPIQNVSKLFPGHFIRFTSKKDYFIRPYFRLSELILKKENHWNLAAYSDLVQSAVPSGLPLYSSQPKDYAFFEKKTITYEVTEKEVSSLEQMVWECDEPVGDLNAFFDWVNLHKLQDNHIALPIGSPQWTQLHLSIPNLKTVKKKERLRRIVKQVLEHSFFRDRLSPAIFRTVNLHALYRSYISSQSMLNPPLPSSALVEPAVFLHQLPGIDRIIPSLSSLVYLYAKTSMPHKHISHQEKILSRMGKQLHLPFLEDQAFAYFLSMPEYAITPSCDCELKRLLTEQKKRNPLPYMFLLKSPSFQSELDRVRNGFCVDSGFLTKKGVETLIKKANNPSCFAFLWALLILEIWQNLFVDN
jgi:asparagine synthase (glutamine-hydrolysing)